MKFTFMVAVIGLALGAVADTNPPQSPSPPIFKGLEQLDNAALREAIIGYYTSESRKKWEKTYRYRSSTYKNTIPYDLYRDRMEEDSQGWILYQLQILSYISEYNKRIEENIYILDISFIDEIEDSYAIVERNWSESFVTGKRYRITNKTIWVVRDEGWVCLDCGRRLHMTFNARFTTK